MSLSDIVIGVVTLCFLCIDSGICQTEDDTEYLGNPVGKLSTYHHQVQGDVYALDDHTFFIKGFTYDGNGPDAFFWAGATNRPGNEGFLIPNEMNRTNVLTSYYYKDVTLTMPDHKKITDIKWLSVYDLSLSTTYGDVTIPDGFAPPQQQEVVELSREDNGVQSKPVIVLDSKTLFIPSFNYDGKAIGARFWVGTGPRPTAKGKIIPDEDGYLGPLRKYTGEDIALELPGNLTVFDIEWFSVYDTKNEKDLGSILLRRKLNVPVARYHIIPNENRLPNCEQLNSKYQVSWEVFGSQITVQLAAQIADNDYMAFGLSGADNGTAMIGSDSIVAYMDGLLGHTVDYNITDKAACTSTVGAFRGVCPDLTVGGIGDISIQTFVKENGITKITFVRLVIPADPGDKPVEDKEVYVVWALGHLGRNKEPLYHYSYSKDDFKINFMRNPPKKNCHYFMEREIPIKPQWPKARIAGDVINFTAVLGPPGGQRGYDGMTGQNSAALVWYLNGYIAPDVYVRRGQRYNFVVYGGNDPNRPQFYHPFYITDDPNGGYEHMTPKERKKVRVYAGVDFDRRARPIPTAVGSLCYWKNDSFDLRRTDTFPTFGRFRNSLQLACEDGDPAVLMWLPNSSVPEVVYYQSFRQSNMGWKIHVVDDIPSGTVTNSISVVSILVISLVSLLFTRWRF